MTSASTADEIVPNDEPPPPRPPAWRPSLPLILTAAVIAALIGAAQVRVPYYSISPGSALDVSHLVKVEAGAPDYPPKGSVFMCTVSLQRTTILQALRGWLDPTVDVVKEQVIKPKDVSSQQLRTVNLQAMDTSKEQALGVAFEQLGYQPVFCYEKYRSEWAAFDPLTGSTPHLVIDETPIGTYAELEGPTTWIDRMLVDLGVDINTCLTDSYGKLFLDWKQRTSSTAENLTFAEVQNSPQLVPAR